VRSGRHVAGVRSLRRAVSVALAISCCAGHPAVASAAEQYHGATLKWVYPLANGDFVIGFNADAATCSAASSPKYMYVAVGQNGVTSDGAKKIYAAALLALGTSRQVNVAFDDATTYCYINRLTVSN